MITAMSELKKMSDFISDPFLRKIAKAHGLDDWEWGADNQLMVAAMMEGAAIAIKCLYEEGRDLTVYVHQSGAMQIAGGPYLTGEIYSPEDEVSDDEIDHARDWEGDPVVKQYLAKDELTLCWDEAGAMFPEEE